MEKAPGLPPCERGVQARSLFCGYGKRVRRSFLDDKGTQSLVISLCRYIVFIMPLAWVLCRQFGPVGVWNAFWATEVLSAIVSLIVYKKSV